MRYMRIQLIFVQYISTLEVVPTEVWGTVNGMRRDGSRVFETEEEGANLAGITTDYDCYL